MDAVISRLIVTNLIKEQKSLVSVDDLLNEVKAITNLLRNEYLLKDQRDIKQFLQNRLSLLRDSNEIELFTDPSTKKDSIRMNEIKYR